jgi:hypothetical protein
MADILLICVSKDAPRAGALAERFQNAGLSVGDVFSSDPALHSATARVLVWSENSHHSLFFRDAASRLFRAGAAVVATLTHVPPPPCFGASLNFDLSAWLGDSCDPALDPLVAAIQQMIVRDLCTQAECWRSIRDSRDPSPLLDYLARYGPDGAFSALVAKRLKQLGPEPRPRPRVPTTALVLAPAADIASTVDQRSLLIPPAASSRTRAPSAHSHAISPPSPAYPAAKFSRTKAASAPAHTNSAPSAARVAATAVRTKPSNATAAAPTNGTHKLAPNAVDALAAPGRRVRMMFPFLIGAVLVGAAYFGALGVSKYAFGPTESLAAPTDAPVLLLNESGPAHISTEPWFEPAPDQPTHRADQVARTIAGDPQSIPHITSPQPSETSASLTLLDAPTMAPLEAFATASTEAVEHGSAPGGDDVVAAPIPEPGAPAPPDGAASDEPTALHVEPSATESVYGPQP